MLQEIDRQQHSSDGEESLHVVLKLGNIMDGSRFIDHAFKVVRIALGGLDQGHNDVKRDDAMHLDEAERFEEVQLPTDFCVRTISYASEVPRNGESGEQPVATSGMGFTEVFVRISLGRLKRQVEPG